MVRVLVVCDSNTSLSPLAKAILGRGLKEAGLGLEVEVDSAGTYPGQASRPVERRIRAEAEKRSLEIETASKPVSRTQLETSDFVLCMNEDNYWFVSSLVSNKEKPEIRLLTKFSKQLGTREIPDPLQGEVGYGEVFQLLSEPLDNFLVFLTDVIAASRKR